MAKKKDVAPEPLTFRGAYIRKFEKRIGPKGAIDIRVHMTSDLTDVVMGEMGWDEISEGIAGADLVGSLGSGTLVMDPGAEFNSHKLELEHVGISGFSVIPVKDGEGESSGRELRFVVSVDKPGSLARLDKFTQHLRRHPSQMKVTYKDEDESDQQPLIDDDADQIPLEESVQGDELAGRKARRTN